MCGTQEEEQKGYRDVPFFRFDKFIRMTPRIEKIDEKKLVGKRMEMSYTDHRIGKLWGSFKPRRKEIKNKVSSDLISLAIYKSTHFNTFNPTNKFERWAAVEVANLNNVPVELETLILPSGLYAVFDYKGMNSGPEVASFFQYIYNEWLPNSNFILDDRPHFEVLGEKYKNNDPFSEEEIWIPIKAAQYPSNVTQRLIFKLFDSCILNGSVIAAYFAAWKF
jgi:AraC family transcriptional regulator